MNNPSLFSETNSATYCPEDDKLRLYVGRVPRDEYEALRAEGWTSTPKQNCDFVAVWKPSRYQTCLSYAGIVEDEDMDPAERAADRAERFSGYLEKRTGEALDRADSYESRDQFHGYQSEAKASREAAKHDRIGAKAVDAWSKAEYWERRTAGVIRHALYKSSPDVRMGRIKTLEAELRKNEAYHQSWVATWNKWKSFSELADPEEQTAKVFQYVGMESGSLQFQHPRPETVKNSHVREHGSSLYTLMAMVRSGYGSSDITGAEACALFFSKYPSEPEGEGDWTRHLKLRLAYENQMLDGQGGRAGVLEMIPGGWIRGGRRLSGEERQIQKVNKSPVTGRVVSVLVQDNHPSLVNHYGNAFPDGKPRFLSHTVEIERAGQDCYRAPTAEELEAFNAKQKAQKALRKATAPAPVQLINPSKEEAKKLMDLWNERAAVQHAEAVKLHKTYGEFKPGKIGTCTQAVYSELSKGTYARAETRGLCKAAELEPRASNMYSSRAAAEAEKRGLAVCKLRISSSGDWWTPPSIIVITDKPSKPLPAAVWESAAELVTA